MYYIMAGAFIGHRAGTKREPDVWRLVGRRQGVRAREGLTLFLGLTKGCRCDPFPCNQSLAKAVGVRERRSNDR
jgi:hypothetical protein